MILFVVAAQREFSEKGKLKVYFVLICAIYSFWFIHHCMKIKP